MTNIAMVLNKDECPVCCQQGILQGTRFDDRYGFPGSFTLFACPRCDHKFLDADFIPAQVEDLYTRYYPRKDISPDACIPPADKARFRAWLDGDKRSAFRWVKPGSRVLDVGCGSCENLLYLRSRGCEVSGVEADGNVLPIAKHFGLNVICGAFDLANYPTDHFDYVTMDQVIEHFPNPLEILAQVRHILKPQGYLICSTPNGCGWGARAFGARWLNWHAPYHLHFFSCQSIMIAAEKTGFRMLKCATITSSDWLLMQWEHLLDYPAPGSPSAYWTKTRKMGLRNLVASWVLGASHRFRMNHAVTRLMDMAGIGDNHLIILQRPAD